jgi:hypothetical protein
MPGEETKARPLRFPLNLREFIIPNIQKEIIKPFKRIRV